MSQVDQGFFGKFRLSSSAGLRAGIAFVVVYVAAIALLRPYMIQVDLLPDQGFLWYVWKLPEATFWSRFTGWAGYTLHQATLWGLIYYAQTRKHSYTSGLHPVNVLALGANALFVLFHLLQTSVWYDGLAQDTPIWSSQGSVILLLVIVLIMENQRRGLFFGHKIDFLKEPGRVLRKYHGYIFSWAVIYTFWYHPMESTYGHLMGTFYTLLLMLQGSLFFTRSHLNRWWTMSLETLVLIHGTMVATMIATDGSWAMFLFGFGAMIIITQMHGLGLSRNVRWGFVVAYAIGVLGVYGARDFENINWLINIPMAEYGLVLVIALLIWLPLTIMARRSQSAGADPS